VCGHDELRADALYHLDWHNWRSVTHQRPSRRFPAWRAEGPMMRHWRWLRPPACRDADGGEAALKDLAEPDQEAASLWHRVALARLSQGDAEAAKRAFTAPSNWTAGCRGYFALQSLFEVTSSR